MGLLAWFFGLWVWVTGGKSVENEETSEEIEEGTKKRKRKKGHRRRPPGKGNDPTAKKSVRVRPEKEDK